MALLKSMASGLQHVSSPGVGLFQMAVCQADEVHERKPEAKPEGFLDTTFGFKSLAKLGVSLYDTQSCGNCLYSSGFFALTGCCGCHSVCTTGTLPSKHSPQVCAHSSALIFKTCAKVYLAYN